MDLETHVTTPAEKIDFAFSHYSTKMSILKLITRITFSVPLKAVDSQEFCPDLRTAFGDGSAYSRQATMDHKHGSEYNATS